MEKIPIFNSNKAEEAKLLEDKVFGQLIVLVVLSNSNKVKYGSLMIGLSVQFSLKNDRLECAVLVKERSISPRLLQKRHMFWARIVRTMKGRRRCAQTTKVLIPATAQSKLICQDRCYCCGKPGHNSPVCWLKDKPKSEWHITKMNEAQQHN